MSSGALKSPGAFGRQSKVRQLTLVTPTGQPAQTLEEFIAARKDLYLG